MSETLPQAQTRSRGVIPWGFLGMLALVATIGLASRSIAAEHAALHATTSSLAPSSSR